ncbi:266_t:CDS:1 [Gigaspora rosea]|nr:266_t:CDS:1 [Gigaspora rosea]
MSPMLVQIASRGEKKCSGTYPCLNCKKRKLECVFIKSNERRGRKPRPKASPSNSDEFIYLNRDLSTLSTPITPEVSTNILSNELQTDITTISTIDELSTHPGLPIIPITESNQTISANNNSSISFHPTSLALYPAASTNNNEYFPAPNLDYYSLDLIKTHSSFLFLQFKQGYVPEHFFSPLLAICTSIGDMSSSPKFIAHYIHVFKNEMAI